MDDEISIHLLFHSLGSLLKNWGCPADLLTSQTVLNPKVHCHTWRALPIGIEPKSPLMQADALPTKPQIPIEAVVQVGQCSARV
jgi:hypothetical protein